MKKPFVSFVMAVIMAKMLFMPLVIAANDLENSLWLSSARLVPGPGQEVVLVLHVSNTLPIAGLQAEIDLRWLDLVKLNKGDLTGDFMVTGAESNGVFRLLVLSLAGEVIPPGRGELVKITFKPREELLLERDKKEISVRLANVIIVDESNERVENYFDILDGIIFFDIETNGNNVPRDGGKDEEEDDPVFDGCFIATVVFGSRYDPAVQLLKRFRDERLLTGEGGYRVVEQYYRFSPDLAAYIAGNRVGTLMARALLLPVVTFVFLLMHPLAWVLMVTLIIICIMMKPGVRN